MLLEWFQFKVRRPLLPACCLPSHGAPAAMETTSSKGKDGGAIWGRSGMVLTVHVMPPRTVCVSPHHPYQLPFVASILILALSKPPK